MKEISLPNRLSVIVTNFVDTLIQEEKHSTTSHPEKDLPKARINRQERRDFFFYTQLINNDTLEVVGHLSDISFGGFKLDTQSPIPVNKDFRFLMNLTSEVANKSFMTFIARSRWCKVDPFDPYVYNVGYQLIHISTEDREIFNRIMEKYGRVHDHRNVDLRRTNKW